MLINWRKNSKPEILIELLNSSRIKNPNGEYSFSGFDYHYNFDLLFGFIDFPERIPEYDLRNILHNVLHVLVKNKSIKKDELIREVDRECNFFIQTPSKRFVLFTSLSINNTAQINSLKMNNSIINFSYNYEIFLKSTENSFRRAQISHQVRIPENYLYIKVFVSARSMYEAADKALDNLDLIRSIWNFYFNLQRQWQISSASNSKPINKILTGPFHTIHTPNGKLISENVWWFDPSFRVPINSILIGKDLEKLDKFTKLIRNQIKKSKYSTSLEEALRRYVRSLDEWDWNNSFIQLWSILEYITYTQNESYDVTIKRAAFIYKDREYIKQILENLREYRNRYVHQNVSDSRVESYLFKLKNIVETIISFHLKNQFKFNSLKEASEFLSLPYKVDDLIQQKKMREKALDLFGS
ncbi:MAG: HEPN domain-containing protein [Anaerolineaceae bacterium]|nr:HEPN domain-containing protein [Anaerolineaceae bacterium]